MTFEEFHQAIRISEQLWVLDPEVEEFLAQYSEVRPMWELLGVEEEKR